MNDKEKNIKIIDFLFKQREFSSDDHISIEIKELLSDDTSSNDLEKIFKDLKANNCFSFENSDESDSFSSLKNTVTIFLEKKVFNFLKLFEYKQKLLGKTQSSIIKPIALEQIARQLSNIDSAMGLIKRLENAGVPDYLIVYPNTKWRMLDDIFRVLATSKDSELNQLLFTILEEFCHPLSFGGNKARALEIQDEFSSLLEYDSYCFYKNKVVEATEEMLQEIAARKEQRTLESNEAMGNFFDLFSKPAPQPVAVTEQPLKHAAHTPINITIHNQNIQNTAKPENMSSYHHTSSTEENKYDDKVLFTEDENLRYNGKLYYDLTPLEKALCKEIFTKEVNFSFKTIDVEESVYPGHETTKNRQDKLKKLVERLNETVKTAFGIVEFIRYSTETLRRLA